MAAFDGSRPTTVIKSKFSSFLHANFCLFKFSFLKLEKIFLFSYFSSEFLSNWLSSKINISHFFPSTSLMNESALSTVSENYFNEILSQRRRCLHDRLTLFNACLKIKHDSFAKRREKNHFFLCGERKFASCENENDFFPLKGIEKCWLSFKQTSFLAVLEEFFIFFTSMIAHAHNYRLGDSRSLKYIINTKRKLLFLQKIRGEKKFFVDAENNL